MRNSGAALLNVMALALPHIHVRRTGTGSRAPRRKN
jgi:hypothetical protein